MATTVDRPWEQLPTIEIDGEEIPAPRGRIKSAVDLNSIHRKFFSDDLLASNKRAQVQAAVNGEAPYCVEREKASGLAGRSNVNFGGMNDFVQATTKPYISILESMDTFGTSPVRGVENEADALRYGNIISKEIARTIKNWPNFYARWGQNVTLMKLDGVSFCYFMDARDWRYYTAGLSKIKFPRQYEASVDAIDIITCEDTIAPHILYEKIMADEKLPEDQRCWDKSAAFYAIKNAGPRTPDYQDYEQWQRLIKGNDITFSTTGTTITIIHGWVRELDGTVSHYIACRNLGDQQNDQDAFLYKEEGKYRSMNSFIHAYFGDFGTNGDFHSIRGEGYKVFPAIVSRNRIQNKLIDVSVQSATPHLSAPTENQQTMRSITPYGPYMLMDSTMNFVQTNVPPLQQNLLPALDQIDRIVGEKSLGSAPGFAGMQGRTQKTKFQVQTEVEQSAALGASDFFLFITSWRNHYKEIVRRMISKSYLSSDPGGKEVHEMIARCIAQGVPKDVIYTIDVDAIEMNTGIGKGSVSERRMAMDVIYSTIYPNLDTEARATIDRMFAATLTSQSLADYLVPNDPNSRPPIDATIAKLENGAMAQGQPPAFEINQNHEVHVGVHLQRLYELNTQFEEFQIELDQAIDQMQPMWEHSINDHMPNISQSNPRYGEYKQALQQLGEFITNGAKKVEKERLKAQEDQQIAQEDEMLAGTGIHAAAVDANARASQEGQLAIEGERNRIRNDQIRAELEQRKMATEIRAKEQQININDVKTATDVAVKLRQTKEKKPAKTK